MLRLLLPAAFVALFCQIVPAQKQVRPPVDSATMTVLEDSLSRLSETIMFEGQRIVKIEDGRELEYGFADTAILAKRRVAFTAFGALLQKALSLPNSFGYAFSNVKSLSVQYPADSSFRIFTWMIRLDNDHYDYGGILQLPQAGSPIFLTNRGPKTEDPEYEQMSPGNWYGAVYYNIRTFQSKGKTLHLLFGYDGYSRYNRRKIVDVLAFDSKGAPEFGSPVFVHKRNGETDVKKRVVLEYSIESNVRLNYDTVEGIIMYDHLIPMKSDLPGLGTTLVTDGSYEGYKLKGGLWQHIDKIKTRAMKQPMFDKPILDARKGKSIFGN